MTGLLKNVAIFGVGFVAARYLLLGKRKDEYLRIEKETIDKIQNKMHDWLKSLDSNADDFEISKVVYEVTTGNPLPDNVSEQNTETEPSNVQEYYQDDIMNEYNTM